MKVSDFKKLFSVKEIEFLEMNKDVADVHTFTFKMPDSMSWTPGQHGVYRFPEKKIKGRPYRVFSLASVEEEKIVRISTRISSKPSDFKANLLMLKPGDTLKLNGPVGWFYADRIRRPAAFIAAGIGITPYIALLQRYAMDTSHPKSLHLYYIAKPGEHSYRSWLEDFEKSHSFLAVDFIESRDDYKALINEYTEKFGNYARYYISGTPNMIKESKAQLKDMGIESKNMVNDPFYGY